MKPFFVIACLTASLSSFAYVKIQEELYIPGNRPEIVKELINSGSVVVDHVTSEGFELYGPFGISKYLDEKNIVYLDKKEISEKALADYPSSAQIAEKLKAAAAKYPRIMKLISIGKSVRR